MGINYVNYSGRIEPEYEVEFEQNFKRPNANTSPIENGRPQLFGSLLGLASINSVNVINKKSGSEQYKPKFVFRANPYASLPEYKAAKILAEKEENVASQDKANDEFGEIQETKNGLMTRHAQLVEEARNYYSDNMYDIENEYLNIDGTFKGVLLNTETGDIALDLPHLRNDERFTTFSINDIVAPFQGELGVLSHTTSSKNAQDIKEHGFDQKLSSKTTGSADGIYFLEGKNAKYGDSEEDEIVNAYYDGNFAEADLEQLEALINKLKSAHEEDFEDIETSGRLSRVFVQNLLSEIGYDGIVADRKDGSKEIVAFDTEKIKLAA